MSSWAIKDELEVYVNSIQLIKPKKHADTLCEFDSVGSSLAYIEASIYYCGKVVVSTFTDLFKLNFDSGICGLHACKLKFSGIMIKNIPMDSQICFTLIERDTATSPSDSMQVTARELTSDVPLRWTSLKLYSREQILIHGAQDMRMWRREPKPTSTAIYSL